MKKLSKLFVSIFASAILSVTSASAFFVVPDVKSLQNEDSMCDFILKVSEEYKLVEDDKSPKRQNELGMQIAQICGDLRFKCGMDYVARFVVMLKAALEGKTERSYLKSLEKIDCDNFIIINDLKLKKLHLILANHLSHIVLELLI